MIEQGRTGCLADAFDRAPALHRPALAEERLAVWRAGLAPQHALCTEVDRPRVSALLAALADHSPYLWRLATKDPDRLLRLLVAPPDVALAQCLDRLQAEIDAVDAAAAAMPILRSAKAEVALLVAMADLGGVWDLDHVVEALTRFADRVVSAALAALLRDAGKAGKLLPRDRGRETDCGMAVLMLGKGGSRELNYSSDIDLVVLYDPVSSALAPGVAPAPFYVRITQALVKLLGERTSDGYVLRVDLRLRPDPGSTAIAISVPAAFVYYETLGQTWERAAFIKARPVAGDLAIGATFLRELAPFIWRKYFDYAAIADVHAMKRQIHAFRGHADVTVPGHDIKLGRGGIREIEFFVQTQQLIFGGRRPRLRGAATLDMLVELQADGWIDEVAVSELTAAYRTLRRIEHRLQMRADEQTQRLPVEADALAQFALFAGYDAYAGLEADLLAQMRAVEGHYARLFEQAPGLDAAAGHFVFSGEAIDPLTVETLHGLGFTKPRDAVETVRGWHFGRRPAVQGARAREVLTELVPALLSAFSGSGDPDAALTGFDAVLGRMPAAVELFMILKSNAALRELFADILGVAPRLAATVSNRPHLLDAAIDPMGRSTTPEDIQHRITSLGRASRSEVDGRSRTEEMLDRARDVAREEQFLIGLRLLAGSEEPARAGEHFADLADAIVRALLGQVAGDFEAEHGSVPGGALAVVAMGKLGSREMTAVSDLDLLIIYDFDPEHPDSDGPRPLAAPRYYTRLSQRLIAALTVATRRGPLYEVDMRLRPSGNQGPLATQLSGFLRYQSEEAETWERMALTRARVVAGDAALGDKIAAIIRAQLMRPRNATLGREIAAVRALVSEGKGDGDAWDLKLAPGAQLDVEFLAQYVVLRHAPAHPTLLGLNTTATLGVALALGLLPPGDGVVLIEASRLYTSVIQILRLAIEGRFDPAKAGSGLKRRLVAAAGLPDFATLERSMAETRSAVRRIFDTILGAPEPAGEPRGDRVADDEPSDRG